MADAHARLRRAVNAASPDDGLFQTIFAILPEGHGVGVLVAPDLTEAEFKHLAIELVEIREGRPYRWPRVDGGRSGTA